LKVTDPDAEATAVDRVDVRPGTARTGDLRMEEPPNVTVGQTDHLRSSTGRSDRRSGSG
jgi:hypothetical protein